ncbi:carboxymuconolactone decarboxylase family protein [Nonomuraea roseoviolacea subsp. roseoviolacea]|uniref:Alkylhydroperoxidase family enzyme n=1 Tax=Nonomuraea roseoviolacea subsp. carminata TaxID=160689 RepID=A0ABT1K8V3_9ACTN|nr:carboxymuconolactone decarboxylase family protein [Nonomuraea roseoviolacea]MCP2350380.1 alkylhydroperoxidase family enzyme [Nonomuraea roseoviolacea subsp. carminata]
MEPRVRPLPPEQWDDFQRANPQNVFTTLGRHPKLYRAWLGFGSVLLYDGTLPARERELAILRTAHRHGSAYEWAHHTRIGRAAGLTDQEIDAVRRDDADWPPGDLLVLRTADELHADGDLSDATWAALCERYDETQRIELVMLIAQYGMLATVLATLRVPLEDA